MGQCDCLQRKSHFLRQFWFTVIYVPIFFDTVQKPVEVIVRHKIEDPRISSQENFEWGKPNIILDSKTKARVRAVLGNKGTGPTGTGQKRFSRFFCGPKVISTSNDRIDPSPLRFRNESAKYISSLLQHFFNFTLVHLIFLLPSPLAPSKHAFLHSRTVQIVLLCWKVLPQHPKLLLPLLYLLLHRSSYHYCHLSPHRGPPKGPP